MDIKKRFDPEPVIVEDLDSRCYAHMNSCLACGALVSFRYQALHHEWHLRQEGMAQKDEQAR